MYLFSIIKNIFGLIAVLFFFSVFTEANSTTVIIDNYDSEFTTSGKWSGSGASDAYAGGSIFSRTLNSSATWTPSILEAGSYAVYVWYAGSTSYNRDTNADYTINHAGGSETIVIDQDQGSGDWVLLGLFAFNAGSNGNVTLLRDADAGGTSADAVKFVFVEEIEPIVPTTVAEPTSSSNVGESFSESTEIIIDNYDSKFTTSGKWSGSGASDAYAGGSIFSRTLNSSAIWTPSILEAGSYAVYVWYAGSTSYNRDTNADYTINHAGGSETIVIDQDQGSGKWVLLGFFTFNAGSNGNVTLLRNSESGGTSADAVKFVFMPESELTLEQNAAVSVTQPITTTAPDGAVVIRGLKTGATLTAARNNSNVLNAALAGGDKNLVIPSGEWYTYNTIDVKQNTTLLFKGKLHQLKHSDSLNLGYRVLMSIREGNVILNNPQLSQKGIVSLRAGTHACLTVYGAYNKGDIIINGGIIEWGASNNFQGGRNNTVFNGTIFRDSLEHLVYANGIFGDGNKNGVADGLIFNDCIFERPGNGLYKDVEANHIQLRNYKNVEINNCVVKGNPKTTRGQYGLLLTSIENLTVNDSSFSGYKTGLLYTGVDRSYNKPMKNVVFNNVVASSMRPASIRKSTSTSITTFNDCTFNNPYGIYGNTKFNHCIFKPISYFMKTGNGAKVTFESCTWDYSNSTYSKAFVKDADSTVNFTGTQTKIAPEDGHSFSWGILAKEG